MSRRFKFFSVFALLLIVTLIAFIYFFLNSHQTQESVPPTMTEIVIPPKEQFFIEITPAKDCSNECTQYQNDQEKYDYCRSVCGFTVENGVLKPPVSTNPELSNDYQLRESAVSEKNIKKCQEIKDTNIRNTCQARVTEDLFEKQSGNGFE